MGTKWMLMLPLLIVAGCGGGGTTEPTEVAEEAEAKPAQVEIIGVDFGFKVTPESVAAGEIETTLVNDGKEPHQAGYYRLHEGVEYDTFVKEIIRDDTQIPQLADAEGAGVMRPIYPGDTYTNPGAELEPGTYALLCSLRDPDTGKNHYEMGMVAKVEVR